VIGLHIFAFCMGFIVGELGGLAALLAAQLVKKKRWLKYPILILCAAILLLIGNLLIPDIFFLVGIIIGLLASLLIMESTSN
jgi:peptidoglycan/LPS O-acetylase OafA/YrhL